MTDIIKKLSDEIMLLPREIRAELVEKILESLNVPTQAEIARLWKIEAEKRVKEYDEGKIEAINGEQVVREIRNRLAR
jgi:putative addiction module component (TIGR02574 family)